MINLEPATSTGIAEVLLRLANDTNLNEISGVYHPIKELDSIKCPIAAKATTRNYIPLLPPYIIHLFIKME